MLDPKLFKEEVQEVSKKEQEKTAKLRKIEFGA